MNYNHLAPEVQLEWVLRDKRILADALKEIYAIRGEDEEIKRIIERAMREACVPLWS
jgi:hypothetical protein